MFDALKNLGNLGDLMKQAGKLKEKMKTLQENLQKQSVSADSGAGMVEATVNGKLELQKIRIDKTKVDINDTEMLEDLICAAVQAAQTKASALMQQEMQKAAGEMGLPPGMLGM